MAMIALAVGLDDRVLARFELRADQRADAGQGRLLKLRIGQVNHLGDEVAGHHLVEILVGEFRRDGIVGQEGLGPRQRRGHLDRREELDARTAGNVGQLQPVQGPLREVVAGGRDELLRIEAALRGHVPLDGESFGPDEVYLR